MAAQHAHGRVLLHSGLVVVVVYVVGLRESRPPSDFLFPWFYFSYFGRSVGAYLLGMDPSTLRRREVKGTMHV